MSRSKDIGNAGERNHRKILTPVWPNIRIGPRYHPTRDHLRTGVWHVESKKRNTWNVKDVVRDMEEHVPAGVPWLICYEDRNRTKKENPSTVVGILPLKLLTELMVYARKGGYNV